MDKWIESKVPPVCRAEWKVSVVISTKNDLLHIMFVTWWMINLAYCCLGSSLSLYCICLHQVCLGLETGCSRNPLFFFFLFPNMLWQGSVEECLSLMFFGISFLLSLLYCQAQSIALNVVWFDSCCYVCIIKNISGSLQTLLWWYRADSDSAYTVERVKF